VEGDASVLNGMRSEIYRQYDEHRKAGIGSLIRIWVTLKANSKKTEIHKDGNTNEITRVAYHNKKYEVMSDQEIRWIWENILHGKRYM
jgi:hypothetical protein